MPRAEWQIKVLPPPHLILPASGLSTVLYIINSGNVYPSVLSEGCYLLFLLFFFSWGGWGGGGRNFNVSLIGRPQQTTRIDFHNTQHEGTLFCWLLWQSEFLVMVYLKWFPVFFCASKADVKARVHMIGPLFGHSWLELIFFLFYENTNKYAIEPFEKNVWPCSWRVKQASRITHSPFGQNDITCKLFVALRGHRSSETIVEALILVRNLPPVYLGRGISSPHCLICEGNILDELASEVA